MRAAISSGYLRGAPYTCGRERSRPLEGVVNERIIKLEQEGFRDVTLLGQNANSYRSENYDFSDLLASCAIAAAGLRIKIHNFTPAGSFIEAHRNYSAKHDNLCKYIHLPVQSGSNRVLDLMKRSYTVEHYMNIISSIKSILPDVSLSTDIISGFCTETEEDHKMTLDIIRCEVKYDGAYMFKYSPREKTKAWQMEDDVDEETKTRRLMEIVELQRDISEENRQTVGRNTK